MSKAKTSAGKKYEELARMEQDYSVKLDADVRGYGNEIFRQILDSVAIDSKKHAALYTACASIVEGRSLSVTDVEYEQIMKSIKNHIKVEDQMLKVVDEELKKTKDARIKMMLEHIKDDEYRHHKLLYAMEKLVVKKEVILEKAVWNQLFRDAIQHGAPPEGIQEEPSGGPKN
jgi:hypothetical protein